MEHDRAALFVRLPAPLVSRLDAHIRSDGRTKQAVVEELLSAHLPDAPEAAGAERRWVLGTVGNLDPSIDEVLDLGGVAALLGIDEEVVLERIGHGDFPARRFGDEWRCSRSAVLAWLAGTDPVSDRSTGFAGS